MGQRRRAVMTLTATRATISQVVRPHELVQMSRGATFGARARTPFFHSSSALGGDPMSVQVTPHPKWVADLDAVLDPSREAILDTRVIVDASENQLVDGRIQNFLVNFYPIIRDFPQWLQVLLDRSPEAGKVFFRDNIRVEKRHDAMWRAMGDGFNVSKERFQIPEPMIPEVKEFHGYLTEMCCGATAQDRKSTRLNSSHGYISYAVFCLQ